MKYFRVGSHLLLLLMLLEGVSLLLLLMLLKDVSLLLLLISKRNTIHGRYVYNNVAPPIFTEIFNKRNTNYQLSHTSHFSVPPVRSVCNGTESLSLLGPKIWDIVPTELKEVKTLSAFKSGIKKWWPQNCPCRLCKRYLPNIGFI